MGFRTFIYKKTGLKIKKNAREEKVKPYIEIHTYDKFAITGFIGRNAKTNKSAESVKLKLLPDGDKRDYLVVCFYTIDNEYAEIVKNLKASLEKYSIPHKLVPLQSIGPWELNCAVKAKFMQKEWELSDIPIVWIDADATIEQDPVLLSQLDCDFAIHKWEGWRFSSGTLYFGKTELAKKLIDQWVVRCEADPVNWDQVSLQSAWCDISSIEPLRSAWLPRSYCSIFDAACADEPVIKHWQLSRKSKADGRITGKPQFEYTADGLKNRKNDLLWLTPEEAFWILEGEHHIKPEVGNDYLDGAEIEEWLRDCIGSDYPLLEIGCGVGRIAKLFKAEEYIGVDVNPTAILHARKNLPEHDFRLIDDGMVYPKAGVALLYTAMLDVADTEAVRLLGEVTRSVNTLIITELMGQRWRREDNPLVFYRNPEDYILIMQRLGFVLCHYSKKDYARYNVESLNVGHDNRITTLVFRSKKIADLLYRELIVNPDPSSNALDTVVLNDKLFRVVRHWFWSEYVKDWEYSTWDFYKHYTKRGGTVIDIGSWIGPTLMFAALCGAKRMIAVEANPDTVKMVERMRVENQELFSGLSVHHAAISSKKGRISFGNPDGLQGASSAASTRGKGYEVDTVSIQEIIEHYKCEDACVIKIDIEGSEFDAALQISQLAELNAAILLSIHPPFWEKVDEESARTFIKNLDKFNLYKLDGAILTREKLLDMITYKGEKPPAWGTSFGNFFEVVMTPKRGMV